MEGPTCLDSALNTTHPFARPQAYSWYLNRTLFQKYCLCNQGMAPTTCLRTRRSHLRVMPGAPLKPSQFKSLERTLAFAPDPDLRDLAFGKRGPVRSFHLLRHTLSLRFWRPLVNRRIQLGGGRGSPREHGMGQSNAQFVREIAIRSTHPYIVVSVVRIVRLSTAPKSRALWVARGTFNCTAAAAIQASTNVIGRPFFSQPFLISAHNRAVSMSGRRSVNRARNRRINSRRLVPRSWPPCHIRSLQS